MCLSWLQFHPCAGSEPDCSCCLSNKYTYMQLRSPEVTRVNFHLSPTTGLHIYNRWNHLIVNKSSCCKRCHDVHISSDGRQPGAVLQPLTITSIAMVKVNAEKVHPAKC